MMFRVIVCFQYVVQNSDYEASSLSLHLRSLEEAIGELENRFLDIF